MRHATRGASGRELSMTDNKSAVLGMRLREARQMASFSQETAAEAVGLLRPAMSLIESGERHLRALELATLARLYSTTPNRILEGL